MARRVHHVYSLCALVKVYVVSPCLFHRLDRFLLMNSARTKLQEGNTLGALLDYLRVAEMVGVRERSA